LTSGLGTDFMMGRTGVCLAGREDSPHFMTHMSPRRREEKLWELHDAVTAAGSALTGRLLRQIREVREKYAVDETAPSRHVPRPAAGLSEEFLAAAAAAVRGALMRVARAQQTAPGARAHLPSGPPLRAPPW
jgi:hypothetical protein